MEGQELFDRYFIHRYENSDEEWECETLYYQIMPRCVCKYKWFRDGLRLYQLPMEHWEYATTLADRQDAIYNKGKCSYRKHEYKALEVFYNRVACRIQKWVRSTKCRAKVGDFIFKIKKKK